MCEINAPYRGWILYLSRLKNKGSELSRPLEMLLVMRLGRG